MIERVLNYTATWSTGQIRQGNWCKHVPESVETSHESNVIMLLSQEMKTDRTIPNNEWHHNPW